jgi:hypothetical protein
VFSPDAASWLSALLAAGMLGLTAWLANRWRRDQLSPLSLFAWCGLVIFLLHPHGKSYEHVAFLVPLAAWAFSRPRPSTAPLLLFWLSSLTASWAAFFLSIQPGAPGGATEWPVLYHLVWVFWILNPSTNPDERPGQKQDDIIIQQFKRKL